MTKYTIVALDGLLVWTLQESRNGVHKNEQLRLNNAFVSEIDLLARHK